MIRNVVDQLKREMKSYLAFQRLDNISLEVEIILFGSLKNISISSKEFLGRQLHLPRKFNMQSDFISILYVNNCITKYLQQLYNIFQYLHNSKTLVLASRKLIVRLCRHPSQHNNEAGAVIRINCPSLPISHSYDSPL